LIYVDSNYWIYWFDSRFPEHEAASKVVEEGVKEGILQSPVTLMEVAHYFRMLPKAQYDELMDALLTLSTLRVRDFDFELARLSVELLGRYAKLGIGGRDAAIVATMMAEGVNKIATHDKAFRAIPDLTVIDPIPDKQRRFKNSNGFTALLSDARGVSFLAFVTFPFSRLAPDGMQRTKGGSMFPMQKTP